MTAVQATIAQGIFVKLPVTLDNLLKGPPLAAVCPAEQVRTNLILGRVLASHARAANTKMKSARLHAKHAEKDTSALQVPQQKPCARKERGAVLVRTYRLV
jgi:hypothetical protein